MTRSQGNLPMGSALSQFIMKLHEEHRSLEDYQGGIPRW